MALVQELSDFWDQKMAQVEALVALLKERRFACYLVARNRGRWIVLRLLRNVARLDEGPNTELVSFLQTIESEARCAVEGSRDGLVLATNWGMWEMAVEVHKLLAKHGLMDDPIDQVIAMHKLHRTLLDDQTEPTI